MLGCELGKIWDLLEDEPLCLEEIVLIASIEVGRFAYYGRCGSLAWILHHVNEEWKVSSSMHQSLALCFFIEDAM